MPREDNAGDTDDFGFDVVTGLFLFDLLGFQLATMIALGAANGTACLVVAFTAQACLGGIGLQQLAYGADNEYGEGHG